MEKALTVLIAAENLHRQLFSLLMSIPARNNPNTLKQVKQNKV